MAENRVFTAILSMLGDRGAGASFEERDSNPIIALITVVSVLQEWFDDGKSRR